MSRLIFIGDLRDGEELKLKLVVVVAVVIAVVGVVVVVVTVVVVAADAVTFKSQIKKLGFWNRLQKQQTNTNTKQNSILKQKQTKNRT